MRFLSTFFGPKPSGQAEPFTAPIAPEIPFVAIGDIHGCDALLERLLAKVEAAHGGAPIICVGDYVDRGEQSREVLVRLMELSEARGDNVVCLRGNHEQMLLDFLDDPAGKGGRWLRFGGLQTLASFGVGYGGKDDLVACAGRLVQAMGPEVIGWLRDREVIWQSGNVAVVHAGADPDVPLAEQNAKTLLWGHRDFDTKTRRDGIWVVHGHTIVDTPQKVGGRIAIDTGAYASNRLTGAYIAPEVVSFIAVS